jgi:hypothetical protein
MTNEQMAVLAKTLVDAASQKNLTLRVLCGTAIFMTCPSIETHPALQRKLGDLDFVAPSKDWDALADIFATHGLAIRTKETAHWILEKDGITVDLCDPKFNHADLSARLALASPTVPLADLLLIKLQRTPFVEKHIQDSIALLLDHRVVRGEAEDQINHEYIGKLCAGNWRLFTTVYDNTVTLEKILDKYLEPEEAQLAWRRIELLQADMDQQPKSFGWMVNQFLRRPTEVPR